MIVDPRGTPANVWRLSKALLYATKLYKSDYKFVTWVSRVVNSNLARCTVTRRTLVQPWSRKSLISSVI